jgi:hypothetical protein
MRDKEISSNTKSEANRKNALESTGPKTPRGQRYSRCNALKHGFYSRELLVSEADQPEFEELRQPLRAQYEPATTMQLLAFDTIVSCAWRCKLGIRLERRQLISQFQALAKQEQTTSADASAGLLVGQHRINMDDIRSYIRLLVDASVEYIDSKRFRKDTEELLTRRFGSEFLETLKCWDPFCTQSAVESFEHVLEKWATGKGISDPQSVEEPNTALGPDSVEWDHPRRLQYPRVVLDPLQKKVIVVMLLDERRHYLEQLLRTMVHNRLGGDEEKVKERLDFNPGFLTAANRELRRAVDWFIHLKEVGL